MHRFWKSLQDQTLPFLYINKRGIKYKKMSMEKKYFDCFARQRAGRQKTYLSRYTFPLCRSFCKSLQDQKHHKKDGLKITILMNWFAWQRGGPCS